MADTTYNNNRRDDLNRRDNDRHLFRLGELDDYKVASDDPDVRGWTVVDRDREVLGTIRELIVDPDQEKVRYLDVAPSRQLRNEGEDRMLFPIGLARIDGDADKVIVDSVDKDALRGMPAYRGEQITRDYETTVMDRFNGLGGLHTGMGAAGGFYDNDLYNEDRFYTTRNRNL